MGVTRAIVAGSVLGLVGAFPPALLFELALRKSRPVHVAAGLVSIMVSFALLTGALIVVWLVARGDVLVFGCAEAASFLLVWACEAWRAWRDANALRPSGRKEEW